MKEAENGERREEGDEHRDGRTGSRDRPSWLVSRQKETEETKTEQEKKDTKRSKNVSVRLSRPVAPIAFAPAPSPARKKKGKNRAGRPTSCPWRPPSVPAELSSGRVEACRDPSNGRLDACPLLTSLSDRLGRSYYTVPGAHTAVRAPRAARPSSLVAAVAGGAVSHGTGFGLARRRTETTDLSPVSSGLYPRPRPLISSQHPSSPSSSSPWVGLSWARPQGGSHNRGKRAGKRSCMSLCTRRRRTRTRTSTEYGVRSTRAREVWV